ncbi:hypothetical protein OsI_38702 [Oryza sativa Indica Group]|uniref:Uncharacterized protein n=1 Tax=Oryza sativa subsp. indica TaxID=39946 RepID=B8BMG7_ORYSI|nr:hypothetical protein OsI_38702 [Oryza sativa Indica Group]
MESGIKTLKWALEGSSHASSRRMKKEPGNGHLSLNKQMDCYSLISSWKKQHWDQELLKARSSAYRSLTHI